MWETLHRFRREVGSEASTRTVGASLILAALIDFIKGLLEHRLYAATNDYIDAQVGRFMVHINPVLLWLIRTPVVFLILMVCAIVIHAYWKSRTSLGENDPRIYLGFDLKESAFSTPIILYNRGGQEAHNVEISAIQLRAKRITFNAPTNVIPKGTRTEVNPDAGGPSPILRRNLLEPLMKEFETYDSLAKETIEIPMVVTYEDFAKNRFETKCDLIFNGVIATLRKASLGDRKVMDLGDYRFRRLPKR
jgi:hypothetical protein